MLCRILRECVMLCSDCGKCANERNEHLSGEAFVIVCTARRFAAARLYHHSFLLGSLLIPYTDGDVRREGTCGLSTTYRIRRQPMACRYSITPSLHGMNLPIRSSRQAFVAESLFAFPDRREQSVHSLHRMRTIMMSMYKRMHDTVLGSCAIRPTAA